MRKDVAEKMAQHGYVSHAAAALGLSVSKPTVARLVENHKIPVVKHGCTSFVLWAKLLAASGPSVKILGIETDASAVFALYNGRSKARVRKAA